VSTQASTVWTGSTSSSDEQEHQPLQQQRDRPPDAQRLQPGRAQRQRGRERQPRYDRGQHPADRERGGQHQPDRQRGDRAAVGPDVDETGLDGGRVEQRRDHHEQHQVGVELDVAAGQQRVPEAGEDQHDRDGHGQPAGHQRADHDHGHGGEHEADLLLDHGVDVPCWRGSSAGRLGPVAQGRPG
jgi:hypothetical protein